MSILDQIPDRPRSLIRRVIPLHDDFVKQSSIVFSASMIANICNYIYQIFVGRTLGPEAYGVFGALFAIFYLIGVFTGAIQAGVGLFVSQFKANGEEDRINSFLRQLIIKSIMLGIAGFLIFALISPWIAAFLNIDSTWEIVIIGTVFLFTFLLPVTTGALQGLQHFKAMSAQNIISTGGKLAFGIILVVIGFGVYGALGAVTLGSFAGTIYCLYVIRARLRKGAIGSSHNFSELYRYSGLTLLVVFCLNVPSNLDVILVKHFLSNYDAGLYVSASVLGKIVLFMSGAIAVVLFPKVAELYTHNQDTRPILNRSLLLTGALSGIVTAGLILFPGIVGVLFGKAYLDAKTITIVYAIMMFAFSLTTVIAQYSLAIRNLRFAYLLLAVTVLEMAGVWFIHGSVLEVAGMLMGMNILLSIASYFFVVWRRPSSD
jgi:O-antigen/teichoic acid export membrane protein